MVLRFLLDSTEPPEDGRSWDNQHREFRTILSHTSLVCRKWGGIQRPKLFASLRLWSSSDVRILLDMLDRPQNEWLKAAVMQIELSTTISATRSFRMLARRLPSLCKLGVSVFYTFPPAPELLSPLLQPFLMQYTSLRSMHLCKITFFSLSALTHLLGDVVTLEELFVSDVSLIHPPASDGQPPTRMPLTSFCSLQRLQCTGEDPWMLVWLLAPLLAWRCTNPPEDATSGNSDVHLLVSLVEQLVEFCGIMCSIGTQQTS